MFCFFQFGWKGQENSALGRRSKGDKWFEVSLISFFYNSIWPTMFFRHCATSSRAPTYAILGFIKLAKQKAKKISNGSIFQMAPKEVVSGNTTETKPYLSSTAVVMAEFIKMISSFGLVLNGCGYNFGLYKRTLVQGLGNLDEMKHIAVPAVLYLFQNNFLFLAIR